jgi:hypothetical protein
MIRVVVLMVFPSFPKFPKARPKARPGEEQFLPESPNRN